MSTDKIANEIKIIVDIQVPTSLEPSGFRRLYETTSVFPTVRRTVGDWVDVTLEDLINREKEVDE